MLTSLEIRHFAIVESLGIEFGDRLTVLTGETGAGKSILIGALGYLLGDRADKTAVAAGASRAELTATFDLRDCPAARDWLAGQALDDDDAECVIRRVIRADGGSRAFVNATPVAVQALKELGRRLVEIHGQHAHQRLGERERQREVLDAFGELAHELEAVRSAHAEWKRLSDERDALASANEERDSRLEFLRFQAEELQRLSPQFEHIEELQNERERMANASRLAEAAGLAVGLIYDSDDGNAQQAVGRARQELDRVLAFDDALSAPLELLDEAEAAIAEAADALRRYLDSLESDPARRDEVETILAELTDAARKHRVDIAGLAERHAGISAELAALESAGTKLADIDRRLAAAAARYDEAAAELAAARRDTAATLAGEVSDSMQKLGMRGGRFGIDVSSVPEVRRGHGTDEVTFSVSANPGQPVQPLARVASGGELSRISLALHVIAAGVSAVPTLIFDEVDVGVGGGVAEIVGVRLAELGRARQVLCVTHLPQVASQGDHHIKVAKITDGNTTRTTLATLAAGQRVDEVARMLGGVDITERTRAHAEEMLARRPAQGRRRRA